MAGGVFRRVLKIMLGNMASSFSVAAYALLRVCCVTHFGLGLVLGSWCGSSGVWLGGGYLWLMGFSEECQRLCWEIWCVRRLSGCSSILQKCENVLVC